MIIIDEYIAVRVILGRWPAGVPDDDLGLPIMGHWRLLQAMHQPRGGQLTRILAEVSEPGRSSLRWPHPEVLQVLDPRPLMDRAATDTDSAPSPLNGSQGESSPSLRSVVLAPLRPSLRSGPSALPTVGPFGPPYGRVLGLPSGRV